MEQLSQELREFIIENFLFGQPTEFSDEDSFVKTRIIDSTGVVELITWIEEKYGIRIKDEEMVPDNLDSIDNLCRFIGRKACPTR